MLSLATILLLASSLGAAGRVTSQSERSPSSRTSSFTDNELQCFAEEKVLYSDGKCFTLRQRGPCLEGQWLVFARDDNNRPRLSCKAKLCSDAARPVYWPEDGQCHKLADRHTLCPRQGNELRSDSYGDGECACVKTFARFEPEVVRGRNSSAEWEGDCYPLYRRGPCPARKLLVPGILQGFGLVARCAADYCYQLNTAEPGASYVLHRADNTCYRLATTGAPCRADESFNVHPMTNHPQCIGRVNTVFSGYGDRCGGRGNINTLTGECREQVFFKAQSFGLEVSRRKRDRRRSRHEQ